MAGFIYIMSNPSFLIGRVKIGKSDRDPEEFRKYELETTGVPESFAVEYYAFVKDHHDVERHVHQKLNHLRPNKQREFFDIPIPKAILLVRSCAEVIYEKSNYRFPEEIIQIKRQVELKQSKRKERERLEKQRLMEEIRSQKAKAEGERQNRVNWEGSKIKALSIFNEQRKIFASKYAKTNTWRWFWPAMLLVFGPVMVMIGAHIVPVVVFGSCIILFAFIAYHHDREQRSFLSLQVYSDAKLIELANLIYRGHDYTNFLRELAPES